MIKISSIFSIILIILIGSEILKGEDNFIPLPLPVYKGKISLEESIYKRKSHRSYLKSKLNKAELSQLCWACLGLTCDGITGPTKAYPSAGACYPLSLYIYCANVMDLETGVYKYLPIKHGLQPIKLENITEELTQACLSQSMVKTAPVTFIIAADFTKTTRYYGKRGRRYVLIEVGHASQNLHLQAQNLGLGTVCIGAFFDESVKNILSIKEEPLYLMPVGRIQQKEVK
jgi:SagB-type dehydrogenase family enzyme